MINDLSNFITVHPEFSVLLVICTFILLYNLIWGIVHAIVRRNKSN